MHAAHRQRQSQHRQQEIARARQRQRPQGQQPRRKNAGGAGHFIFDKPLIQNRRQLMAKNGEQGQHHAGKNRNARPGLERIRKQGWGPGGNAVSQNALEHKGQHNRYQRGQHGPAQAARTRLRRLPGHGKPRHLKPPVPFQPHRSHDHRRCGGYEKHQPPAAQGDEQRRGKIHRDGAQGAAPAHPDHRPLIRLLLQMQRHHLHQGRPHHGLGQAVHAPNRRHPSGGGAQGNEQIHGGANQQAAENQQLRGQPVPQIAADQLAHAIGDEQSRQRGGGAHPGKALPRDDLHHHGGVIMPGQIAAKIHGGAQQRKQRRLTPGNIRIGHSAWPSQSASMGTFSSRATVGAISFRLMPSKAVPGAKSAPQARKGMVISSGISLP